MRRRQICRYARAAAAGVVCLAVIGIVAWGFAAGNATLVTAATALLVFALGEYRRWQLAAQQDRWGRIADEYEKFFALIRRQVRHDDAPRHIRGKQAERRAEEAASRRVKETEEAMARFADKLMLWGSERVIRAWVHMRRNAAEGEPPRVSQMEDFGRMVLAIRREFGHTDWRLEERDLFRIIFNDEIETLLAKADLRDSREVLETLTVSGSTVADRTVALLCQRVDSSPRQLEYVLTGLERQKPPFVRRSTDADTGTEYWDALPAGIDALEQLRALDLDEGD